MESGTAEDVAQGSVVRRGNLAPASGGFARGHMSRRTMVGAQAAERKPRLWVWLKADDESYSVLCLGASGRCPRRDARWARGGEVPAADTGLRQQHGFPRVATGWKAIPLALSRAWKTGSEVGVKQSPFLLDNQGWFTLFFCRILTDHLLSDGPENTV